LFSDTIRSLRVLALAHRLGHALMAENDAAISLLDRLVQHARTTAKHNVYYGTGRDLYDVRGRVVHESIFNTNDGRYRCPSTQQGYSPFSTWTRGLAWIMCGYAEQLEFLASLDESSLAAVGGRQAVEQMMRLPRYVRFLLGPRRRWRAVLGHQGPDWGNWEIRPAGGSVHDWAGRQPARHCRPGAAAIGPVFAGPEMRRRRYWQAGLTVRSRC
jgi:hypothetical protein